ncbi:MAG: ABC transporter ATP-binding protein/permease [Ruminococcaceae bacterium]|nr:ABC transporter ATP-binding protein/permease [Oscillospiraceae bacterium]
MLELKNIKKDYPAGDGVVEALKGINLTFRKSEFVSILGPSGCGKTTMLNIIGGLDQYTEGDLVINNRSTKDFKDRDWDSYRNHSIGFVFQSYNLIPHQTVLQNVELALTLSGVSKAERRKRARQALEQVGLSTQLNKKPSEMSGGQMQRVAIARAIVNNPDIILADEPTGALDTETSVQVMDILKEISKDRLVIMVTHNPEIAERYSTRIIRMLDGVITDDSAPVSEQEIALAASEKTEESNKKTGKKPSMSLFTAFGLSLKNLFTKKGRTMLTSFAGSIGIIGIALIYAVSNGMTAYIDKVQEDTLSSYPITLEAKHMDVSELMATFMGAAQNKGNHGDDAVYTNEVVYNMLNALNNMETNENDLKSFNAYLMEKLEDKESELSEAVSGVQYTYDTELLVYTKTVDGNVIRSDTQRLLQEILTEYFGMDMNAMMQMGENYGMTQSSPMMSMGNNAVLWQEMLTGDNGDLINPVIKKQYDLVYGSWPNSYNEIILVLDKNNELEDMTLYALGLKSKADIDAIMQAAMNKTEVEGKSQSWSYEEICDMEFKAVLNSNSFVLDEKTGLYNDLSATETGRQYLYDNGITLKVTGIIRPNEDAVGGMLRGSIGYTKLLTEYIINESGKSSAVKAQLDNPYIDIFTGLPFKDSSSDLDVSQKAAEFKEHITQLDDRGKAESYIKIMSIPEDSQVKLYVEQMLGSMTREKMEATLSQVLSNEMNMNAEDVKSYVESMSDEDMKKMFSTMISEQYKKQYAEGVKAQLSAYSTAQLSAMLQQAFPSYTEEMCAKYYDEVLVFSESDYETNMSKLGNVDLDNPSTINLFASTFDSKDVIEAAIADYNKDVEEMSRITYTDYIGIMLSFVTTVIDAITYVLIAFVSISLVVSSIMIGVITLISVQERTKEIGILRAIGASKRNVSSMFNAETVIIGFSSGALGVIITYLLCIPINIILHAVTGISALNAQLPILVGLLLVGISILLNLFSGIIPSRSAAKKDPVVALRTE